MHFDFDEERYVLDLPTECPKCGTVLELDQNIDGHVDLLCPNTECDFCLDVTDEFKAIEETDNDNEDNI